MHPTGTTTGYGNREPNNGTNAGFVTTDTPESIELPHLQPNTTYHYQIVAFNVGVCFSGSTCPPSGPNTTFGEDQSFTTLALAPVVSADPPERIESNSATLTGSVNPQGVAATYHFEYGTTTTYGTSLPDEAVAATKFGFGVSANIVGLAPNTTYHYRLVAANNGGAANSPDETFTTYGAGVPSTAPPPLGFSLTGTAPAGPAAAVFPNLTGFTPMPPPPAKPTTTPKPLTNAQKLAKALKACKKDKSKSKRVACERQTRHRYGTSAKKKDTKKSS